MRAFYTGWYNELVEGLPVVAGGEVTISERPDWASSCCPASTGGRTRSSAFRRP